MIDRLLSEFRGACMINVPERGNSAVRETA